MDSDPVVNALDATEVGVAVKFAKVPPTAATATIATAPSERRIFVNVVFLNMRVPFWGDWTRRASERAGWVQAPAAYEFSRSGRLSDAVVFSRHLASDPRGRRQGPGQSKTWPSRATAVDLTVEPPS